MEHDANRILATLARHEVPFVIIGGLAVYHHGHTRMTEDVDVVWNRSPVSEIALAAALLELNARYLDDVIDPETRLEREIPVTLPHVRSHHLMMLTTSAGFLDLFDFLPGLPLEPVEPLFATAIQTGSYRYASRDWLIRLKRISGRWKDIDDIEHLPPPTTD